MATADEREHREGAALRDAERDIADGSRDGGGGGDLEGIGGSAGDEGDEQQPVGEAVLELLSSRGLTDRGRNNIAELQTQRRELAARKRQLTKELRKESRKRSRMLARSARLSNVDLVEVLQIRQNRAVAKAKASAADTVG